MVTAKGSEYDKVVGLDSGADDYVTKPFGMMELVSRIKAVLRRSGKVEDRMDMETAGVHMDVKKHEVTVDGKEISLTLKEFELLEKLMRNQGIVLTRDQLLTEIWGYDFDGETRTVDVHIRTLRQKLGEKGEIIQTVRGSRIPCRRSCMRKKIQRSMVMVLAVTLLLSYIILTLITYNTNLSTLESEVRQEAEYIRTAINISGAGYLEEMDGVDWTTRVTQIDEDGNVLYDTRRDSSTLENHSGRKEVREALAEGEGEDVRMSDTVGQEMYYYALLLDDGTVLRASKSMDGLVRTALGNLPVMAGLAAIMLILAYFYGKMADQTSGKADL